MKTIYCNWRRFGINPPGNLAPVISNLVPFALHGGHVSPLSGLGVETATASEVLVAIETPDDVDVESDHCQLVVGAGSSNIHIGHLTQTNEI